MLSTYYQSVGFDVVGAAAVGATITAVDLAPGNEEGSITTTHGVLRFWHDQGCCERVEIEDIIGDPADIIGGVIVLVEERDSSAEPAPANAESYTWTFYEVRTTKGDITIRWLGESNGYYSESVDASWTPTESAGGAE